MVQNPVEISARNSISSGGESPDVSAITLDSSDFVARPPAPVQPKAVKKKVTTKKNLQSFIKGNDIRARYPDIFSQIFNNYDKLSFSRIMNNYCENDLLVIYEYVGSVNPFGPNYLEVRGLEAVVVFWDSLLTSIPDSLFESFTPKFKILPNDFTSIVCPFSFKGTKMYEISGIDENSERSVVVSLEKASLGSGAGKVITSLASNVGENSPVDPQTSKPMYLETGKITAKYVHLVGTLTFYVNPNKKIYRISFVHSLKPSEVSLCSADQGHRAK